MAEFQVELKAFKEKLKDLLKKSGGKILFNQFCTQFRTLYGQNIRNFFDSVKIGRVLDLLTEHCKDVVEVDTSNRNNIMVYEIGKASNPITFSSETSSAICERQLQKTVAHMQGLSKSTAIVVGKQSESEEESSEDDEEENEVSQGGVLVGKKWKQLAERSGFNIGKVLDKFTMYREFQMIHLIYCKLRITILFNNYGNNCLPIPIFRTLFKEMYRENFFVNGVLLFYVSDIRQRRDCIKDFLKRFCGDFLVVNDEDLSVTIVGNLTWLHEKYLNLLLSEFEKVRLSELVKQTNPIPPAWPLLGDAVDNTRIVDVMRVPDKFGNYSTVMEFPHPQNRSLFGRERPTITEINERVNQIRTKICRDNRVILITEILRELCAFYHVSSVRDLHPMEREIRREIDIPAIYEIMRLQGKVNAFIQAFIQFRNICTLYELDEELAKMEGKSSFVDLKLGPLQKQLLVHHFFQFPLTKEEIPGITTYQVFRLLWKCLSRHHRGPSRGGHRTQSYDKLTIENFMNYVMRQHNFSSPFESGVKVGNIAAAIQTVKRAFYGDMNHVKETMHKFQKQLCADFDQHLAHLAQQVIKPGPVLPGDSQTLVQRISGMPIIEGFNQMYTMLQNMKREACKTLPGTTDLINFSDITMNALSIIQKDDLMSRVFHVLLSTAPLKVLDKDDEKILKFLGFQITDDDDNQPKDESGSCKSLGSTQLTVTPKATVLEITKKWLLNITEWNLNTLSRIECQIAAEVDPNYNSFDKLGHGPFLKFLCSDKALSELLDFSSSGMLMALVKNDELTAFIQQCDQKIDVSTGLSVQFNMKFTEKQVQRLVENSTKEVKKNIQLHVRYLQALLTGTEYHKNLTDKRNVEQIFKQAKQEIEATPYLLDISEFTNWPYMFENQLGGMKDFLMSAFKDKDCPFIFMEVRRNCVVKLLRHCSTETFVSFLDKFDPLMTSACLLSILNSSGHITNTPIALLSNHIQNTFLKVSSNSDSIINFTLQCFEVIPFDLLCCVVTKMFLDPLAQVFGRLNVSDLLLRGCEANGKQRSLLHALGVRLCISGWLKDYEKKFLKESNNMVTVSTSDEKENVMEENAKSSKPPDKQPRTEAEKLKQVGEVLEKNVCETAAVSTEQSLSSNELMEVQSQKSRNSKDESVDHSEKMDEQRQLFIDQIRREQFGIGEVFGEKERKLIEVHREREGRSLHRLSKELYTKDSHFVLELIQNADDNDYPEHMMTANSAEKPTVAFIVEQDKVTILNNEVGFMEKNIKALCDVGRSTKGIHRKGYIGQKGIGFKSVFRVTDCPEIHSNGFHIKFDASTGPNGYILPEWIETTGGFQYQPQTNNIPKLSWSTKIILHLKEEIQHSKLSSRFHDIHPSLLMFLNRLHTIIIDDKLSGLVKIMTKKKIDQNLIVLSNNEEKSSWFSVTQEIPINIREDTKTTDISVAFPIHASSSKKFENEILSPQPVFAYLPLRSYGFRFIIQADFEVPSSREDIDKDSTWNQCILQHLPTLIIKAFHYFKTHDHFTGFDGVTQYFQFMELEDHVLGIFKQVARQVVKGLQREACLPVHCPQQSGGEHKWVIPSSVVLSRNETEAVISSSLLQEHLGLHYIHGEIQSKITNVVYESLGVCKLSLDQLVEIAKHVVRLQHWQGGELHAWIGKWLLLVYSALQESFDSSEKTMEMIRALRIYALCDGRLVSLNEFVVFFPVDAQHIKSNGPLQVIEKDLSILSHSITDSLDLVEKQLVTRLLRDLGLKTMTPHDLVHDYILPLFKTNKWKEKSEDLVIACTIYLQQQFVLDENLFDLKQIQPHLVLMTNKGFKHPSKEIIYLSSHFGNKLNLEKDLPACDWTLISPRYLLTSYSSADRKTWQEFFTLLGLKKFACLQKKDVKLHRSDLVGSVWEKLSETWEKTSDDTYIVSDLACPEFGALVKSKEMKQLQTFGLALDKIWDESFKAYDLAHPKCVIKNSGGEPVGMTTYSSFYLQMNNTAWIKASSNQPMLHLPRDLFFATNYALMLLSRKVKYVSPQYSNRDFVCTVGVQMELQFERFIEEFKKWREEKLFSTTYHHILNIYKHLREMYDRFPNLIKELVDGPCVFLLSGHCNQQLSPESVAEGKFFERKDLCWEDPSGIMLKSESVTQRRVLRGFYPNDMKDFFVRRLDVDPFPSTGEYLNVVSSIANKTTLPDVEACHQIYIIFSILASSVVDTKAMKDIQEWGFPRTVTEKVSLYQELKEWVKEFTHHNIGAVAKIFPVSCNEFVGLKEKPILVLDEDLARIYKKGNAPLIYLSDVYRTMKPPKKEGSSNRRNEERDVERKIIKIMVFFKSCGLPLLRDIVEEPEVVPEHPKKGFVKWHYYLHELTPYIQRYIFTKYPDYHARMQSQNFSSYLKESLLFEVSQLEVIHRLKDRDTVNVKLSKTCNVQDMNGSKAYIYVVASSKNDRRKDDEVFSELLELFVSKSEDWRDRLYDFVLSLTSVSRKEDYLKRKQILPLPSDHEVWEYPELEKPKPQRTPTKKANDQTKEHGSREKELSSWPPPSQQIVPVTTEVVNRWNLQQEENVQVGSHPAEYQSNASVKETREEVDVKVVRSVEGAKRKRSEESTVPNIPSDLGIAPSDPRIARMETEVEPQAKKVMIEDDVSSGYVVERDAEISHRSARKFDPRNFKQYELVEKYEDVPILIDQDLEEGEVTFLQRMETNRKNMVNPIGIIGEQFVYQHLSNAYKDEINAGNVVLRWLNEDEETGEPYDIMVKFADHMNQKPVFVEVKTTSKHENKEFEISSQQLRFAFNNGPCFHLYRVSGISSQADVKLRRLVNLSTYMDNKTVRLFMVL